MMEDVIQFRLDDKTHDMIDYDTPSTIPCNIATIDRPPKEDIISRHKSSFFHTHDKQHNNCIIYLQHTSLHLQVIQCIN